MVSSFIIWVLSCLNTHIIVHCEYKVSLNWTEGNTTMPETRWAAFGGYNSKTEEVWIFGGIGYNQPDSQTSIFAMDINTNIFSELPEKLPNGFKSAAQCWTQLNNTIYFIDEGASAKTLHAINMDDYQTSNTFISDIPQLVYDAGMSCLYHLSYT